MSGLLALVGGAEFTPGNEPCDRRLVAAAGGGPALIVPTAAARQAPERAVATATRWFAGLGLQVDELMVLCRGDAASAALADRARAARLLYLTGGDPGLVVSVLRGSRVWQAMLDAWQAGAALAGSSAGAMALCESVLLLERWPDHRRRRHAPGIGVVPGVALIPHFDTFGAGWVESALAGASEAVAALLGVDERSACLWDGSRWLSTGPGAVTLIDTRGTAARFEAGEAVAGLPPPASVTA